jgi:nitroimidazol reductase NimA-like FMN-containing flavoprotein (pyridoxamine 5'-phosphate oxidase superfamily)
MPKKDYSLQVTPANAQRRPEYAQDDVWIREFLGRASTGHVATRWDDQPFITPTNFWYDAERHEIIFHSNIVGRVRANSERHPQVCFEASEFGRLLPSNVALDSVSSMSVIVLAGYGSLRL